MKDQALLGGLGGLACDSSSMEKVENFSPKARDKCKCLRDFLGGLGVKKYTLPSKIHRE
jgi:hypothetical protein